MLIVGVCVPLLIGSLMVRRVRLTFDQDEGTLTRTCRTLRGLARDNYPLQRLERAELGSMNDSDGTPWRTELPLKAPLEAVPFTSHCTNGTGPERMVGIVNDWLIRQS